METNADPVNTTEIRCCGEPAPEKPALTAIRFTRWLCGEVEDTVAAAEKIKARLAVSEGAHKAGSMELAGLNRVHTAVMEIIRFGHPKDWKNGRVVEWHPEMQEVYVKIEAEKSRFSEMQSVIEVRDIEIRRLTGELQIARDGIKGMQEKVDQYALANGAHMADLRFLKEQSDKVSAENRRLKRQMSGLRRRAGVKPAPRKKH